MSARLATVALVGAAWLAASLALPAPAWAQRARLQGSLPPTLAGATEIGPLDPARVIGFAITLPVRDPQGLTEFLRRLYTPGDPLFHHYLSTGEFAARFGPTVEDYDAVAAFAGSQGLRVTRRYTNRTVLDVEGPVAGIERALNLHLREYRSAGGRVFHAPDAEPEFPTGIAGRIEGVVGLDDAVPPRPDFARAGSATGARKRAGPAAVGTGQGTALSPSDIRTMYDFDGVTQDGSGNTIALMELDGYTASDITAYEDQYGLPHVGMLNVLLDGVSGTPTAPTAQVPFPGSFEVTLDIDLALALAPGAHQIDVYEGTNIVNVFNQIASDNSAQVVSCSWGIGEQVTSASVRNSLNTTFQQLATQGQSLFCASGDNGDQACTAVDNNGNCTTSSVSVQNPASQPYCTGVGGTTVTTESPGGAWQSETAWSGSGGGVSTVWTLPYYQSAGVNAGSGGSGTFRNVPDVSLDSNSGYSVYYNSAWDFATGTSCAAPLWAAFTARLNQRRAGLALGNIGFINPALSFVGHTSGYGTGFHDITTGNNGTYAAVRGYDNVTGWGSFDGANLLPALSVDPGVFWVDVNYGGAIQNGSTLFPYRSLSNALAAVPSGRPWLLYVRGGSYLENITISQNVVLVNNGGGVVGVGQ